MSKGIITVRSLKNKDTGIDISIPSYKDIPGLLGGTTEYHVLVVTNMTYFKTSEHKESNIVQFSITKRFGEFEELYNKLSARYSSTILPSMPSKVGFFNDGLSNERKSSLDNILKFVAANKKLSTSPLLLEFLGADNDKVEKLVASLRAKDEPDVEPVQTRANPKKKSGESAANLFDEVDTDEEDLFVTKPVAAVINTAAESLKPDAMFDPLLNPNVGTKKKAPIRLYEEQDLESAISPNDDFFIPGAKVEMDTSEFRKNLEEDLDLLSIDDDLDKILNFPERKPKPSVRLKPLVKPKAAPRHHAPKPVPLNKDLDNPEAIKLADEDIMKYINENLEAGEKNTDLF